MKKFGSTVNKESFGHQSIATAWAVDDGKPKPPKDGCSEEEEASYCKSMTEWALRGSLRIAELDSLNKMHESLTKKRIGVSMEYAQTRRQMQSEKDMIGEAKLVIDNLLLDLNTRKDHLCQLDKDGKMLLIKRQKIDEEKAETIQKISDLKSQL